MELKQTEFIANVRVEETEVQAIFRGTGFPEWWLWPCDLEEEASALPPWWWRPREIVASLQFCSGVVNMMSADVALTTDAAHTYL